MIEIKVREVLGICNAKLKQGSPETVIKSISTDSRNIKHGDVFLALKGPNFDGADYVQQALQNGAAGYICERTNEDADLAIKAEDPLKFLHLLAKHILQKVDPKVIAVTGSTGKTSVKDMLRSVLSQKYDVVASKANYNNEIGLPLTILSIAPDTQVVILEMAMRGLGHIDELCRIAQPDLAVVTNIGNSHIELLGSKENIIKAKAEIIACLKDNGTLFVNADDESTPVLRELAGLKNIISFGKSADVSCEQKSIDELARYTLIITAGKEQQEINMPIPGMHHALNACAVAAVALHMDMSFAQIKKGIEEFELSPGRMEVFQENGLIILNDAYNSSPDSALPALDTLKSISSKRKIAILGSMLELGKSAKDEHERIGRHVAYLELDGLITVGDMAKRFKSGAVKAGMSEKIIKSFSDYSELEKEIDSLTRSSDAILVKGSRKIELENIVYYLQKKR